MKDKRVVILGLTLIVLAWTTFIYAAVPQSTIRTTGGGVTTYVAHYINATLGYWMGNNEIINPDLEATLVNITIVDSLTLGGVTRDTWPAAGTGGGLVAPTFIIYRNNTGQYRSINGTDGTLFTDGPIWDFVMNTTTLACQTTGGKITLKEGNYTKEINLPVLVFSNTEIELQDGAMIWLHANKTDGVQVFKADDAENIVIHGNGMIDGNKGNQSLGYQIAVEFNNCTHCKVDTYIQHMKGWNLLDRPGGDDQPTVYINRFYPDASKKIDPFIPDMLNEVDSWLIDNCSDGWAAAFGSITYVTDYMTANYSMKGTPAGAGAERLRFNKIYNPPLNLTDVNIGIWIKGQGEFDSGLDIQLELWDTLNVNENFIWYNIGDELNGSEEVWSFHMFSLDNPAYGNAINMSDVDDFRIRVLSGTNDWNLTIDEIRAYPMFNNNPRIMFTFDGPYPKQWLWVWPILNERGYHMNIATSYDIPGESPGNGGTYLAELKTLYEQGNDIVVYGRIFDEETPPRPLSDAESLDFVLRQKQWLIDNGFTRSANFLHCNRHLMDVGTYELLSDYFYFIKGDTVSGANIFSEPFPHFDFESTVPATDLTQLEKAYNNSATYGFFNHFNAEAYTRTQFETFVDRAYVNYTMTSITWSELYEELTKDP